MRARGYGRGTSNHIIWGGLEHPRTTRRGGRSMGEGLSDAAESSDASSLSSANEVPDERSAFNQLRALSITPGEVSFLPPSDSSNDSSRSKRNFPTIPSEHTTKDNELAPILDERAETDLILGLPAAKGKVKQLSGADAALQQLRSLQAYTQADVNAYNNAMAACIAAGDMERAQQVYFELCCAGMQNEESARLMSMTQQMPFHQQRLDTSTKTLSSESNKKARDPNAAVGMGHIGQRGHHGQPPAFTLGASSSSVGPGPGFTNAKEQLPSDSSSGSSERHLQNLLHEFASEREHTRHSRPGAGERDSNELAQRLQRQSISENRVGADKRDSAGEGVNKSVSAFRQFEGADEAEIARHVPRDALGNPTSIGSLKHELKQCTPCMFINGEGGCKNGVSCMFCHFPHEKVQAPKKQKYSKVYRDRYKKLVSTLTQQMELCPETYDCEAAHLPDWIKNNEPARVELCQRLETARQDLLAQRRTLQ